FQAEDGIRDRNVTGVQTCALPISPGATCAPTSASACAASLPATRIRAMISGVLTSGSPVLGRFLPTYSGRVISAGTWRVGESRRSEERRVGKECGDAGRAGRVLDG